MEFRDYKDLVAAIPLGKRLPDAVYLHESALPSLPAVLAQTLASAIVQFDLDDQEWNIVKFFRRDYKIALLNYPDFFEDAYPSLHTSYTLDLQNVRYRKIEYKNSDNPPILHRKETFLSPEHPAVPEFQALTLEGENAGLYEKARSIGFKRQWERLIQRKGYRLAQGRLVPLDKLAKQIADESHADPITVDRHLTAIDRNKLSQPMQLLARHNYLNGDYSILDYGCGKGDDARELEAHGIDVSAWDPIHRPDGDKRGCDIVNLGYVINVIEDRQERTETLQIAYKHTKRLLTVSAMVAGESLISQFPPYKDGVLTSRNTFQKYYTQAELKYFIESSIGECAIAVSHGIFFIFKDKIEEQIFLSERQHVRRTWRQLTFRERKTPESRISKDLIEKNQALFDHFWDTALDLGRIPANPEFEFSDRIRSIAGSHAKAFSALKEHYGEGLFEKAKVARREDLLVYFSLGLFGKRRPYKHMPEGLKRDIKAFFQSYAIAVDEARELLFSIANPRLITDACSSAYEIIGCGQLNEGHSLVIHSSLLSNLPAILRIYIGSAIQLYGDIDDIDLIKIHMLSGKVTLMKYDDFQGKPIPELTERIKIKLREQDIDFFDYVGEYQPQPLYFKSCYIPQDFPNYKLQRKFDGQLSNLNLFDFTGFGPKKDEFNKIIAAAGWRIIGYNLLSN